MKIKSMTGFGRGSGSLGGLDFTLDVKSVNHRFFDFSARIYKDYAYLEDPIKTRVAAAVTRGKIDVYLHMEKNGEPVARAAKMDRGLAEAYLTAAKEAESAFGIPNDLTVSRLFSFPDVLTVQQPALKEEEVAKTVLSALDQALGSFLMMRAAEGEKLKKDLQSNLGFIEEIVLQVEVLAPASVEAYRSRLEEKIRETLEERNLDEGRILTEVAIFADKVAVDEETVRMRSHLSQFRDLLEHGGPVGKKLDFLVQEMNREINTIGSKCSSIEITRLVVDAKACIEKIREQIQNVE